MMHPQDDSMKRAIFYWASTTLAFAAFMGSGLANLLRAEHVAADMVRLGYPGYFSTILGAFKVAGAICIVVPRLPRLKEWAYAGMVFDLSGAALSRAAIGDQTWAILAPLVVMLVVLASWKTRPGNRTSRAFSWTQRGLAHRTGEC